MFELKEYCRVKSLEQADQLLNEDKKNVILGGLLWMRMGSRKFHLGIDLTGLGLDRIEDTGEFIEIGAMASLGQVETSSLLQEYTGDLFKDALGSIVGVQFRNLATAGGSIFSRFSFSDLATALMVLDTRVHLFRGGVIPLKDFMASSPGRDILVKLSIPKLKQKTSYQSIRMSATDFPVLAAAISLRQGLWHIALGARPSRAKQATKTAEILSRTETSDSDPEEYLIKKAGETLVRELSFGSNNRGSRTYREAMAKVLLKRGVQAICR